MTSDLIEMLSRTGGLTVADVDRVIAWARTVGHEGESVPEVLIRSGFLQSSAMRTLDLIRRGFVTPVDGMILLAPDAVARIRSEILAESAERHYDRDMPTTVLTSRPPAAHPTPHDSEAVPYSAVRETISTPPVRHTSVGRVDLWPAAAVPEVGTTLGKCLLTGVLGKGGHGIVYSALHQTLNVPVAVKVLLGTDGGPADSRVRTQLRHEAQTLARLGHGNVIRVLDYDDGPVPYVVMEFVEGPSLADLITQTGSVRPDRAMAMLRQTAEGLAAAWKLKIVHRDIKPGNILITRDGTAKIADLGLAMAAQQRSVTSQAEAAGMPVGTCAYMAPEQAQNAQAVDFRADIYALGATFYHAITGRMPFAAQTPFQLIVKHAMEPIVPPHTLGGNPVDRPTSDLIVRMMAKAPADRFESYEDLIAAVDQLATGTPGRRVENQTPPVAAQVPTIKGSGIVGRLFQFRRPDPDTGRANRSARDGAADGIQ